MAITERELAGMGEGELRDLAAKVAAERAAVEREQGGHDIEARGQEWAIQRMLAAKRPPMAGAPGAFWYWRER